MDDDNDLFYNYNMDNYNLYNYGMVASNRLLRQVHIYMVQGQILFRHILSKFLLLMVLF